MVMFLLGRSAGADVTIPLLRAEAGAACEAEEGAAAATGAAPDKGDDDDGEEEEEKHREACPLLLVGLRGTSGGGIVIRTPHEAGRLGA